MAIRNEELVHQCFPKHLRKGTARLKKDKDTEEECKKSTANMEIITAGTRKKSQRPNCSSGCTGVATPLRSEDVHGSRLLYAVRVYRGRYSSTEWGCTGVATPLRSEDVQGSLLLYAVRMCRGGYSSTQWGCTGVATPLRSEDVQGSQLLYAVRMYRGGYSPTQWGCTGVATPLCSEDVQWTQNKVP